jgi:excisionase family DNA binding protein
MQSIPTLDEIARDGSRADGLPKAALLSLLLRTAAVQSSLTAQLVAIGETEQPERGVPQSDRWMTAKQIAEHLEIKESWVMSEARAKRIPKHMVGRYVRFDLAEVQSALEQAEVQRAQRS